MATVFRAFYGVLIDYLGKVKIINGEYYITLLNQLYDAFKAKRPHLAKKKLLFHQHHAPTHTIQLQSQNDMNCFEHTMFIRFSPSDFFLFLYMKK